MGFILNLGLVFSSEAQISQGGVPLSFSRALPPDTAGAAFFTPPDEEMLEAEDRVAPVPYRFSVNLTAGLDIRNTGNWTTAGDGTRIWRCRITAAGARALLLYFDRFRLPEGGRLFVYNPGRTQVLGAFTAANQNRMNTFATGLLMGDQAEIEYNAPAGAPLPELRISEVGYAYRGIAQPGGSRNGFKGSGDCQVNINCTEGTSWQVQKRGVTRIAVKRNSGSVWCSGSLVDNVRHDGKPYLLTADHCGVFSSDTNLSQWIFYFNYESADCPVPDQEPPYLSLTGAKRIAHGGNMGYNGSDFFLVLLDNNVPSAYNAYYNGWSRETDPVSPSGVCIHHPMGDIKKVSTYSTPVAAAHWAGGLPLSHWRVNWTQTGNGHGTTEGGSSGSPLFNSEGLIIGTLTGGESSCDSAKLTQPDYFGMFSYHWDQNGTDSASVLKYWLDPDNTGVTRLKGWAMSAPEPGCAEKVVAGPNPVGDHLRLQAQGPERERLAVTLSDVFGNVLFRTEWMPSDHAEQIIPMAGFRPGIYLLTVGDGLSVKVHKIIKQ